MRYSNKHEYADAVRRYSVLGRCEARCMLFAAATAGRDTSLRCGIPCCILEDYCNEAIEDSFGRMVSLLLLMSKEA
jgi:hypothetical protein